MTETGSESVIQDVLRKMKALLSSRALAWYGGKTVEFVHQSHYVDFDDMLGICGAFRRRLITIRLSLPVRKIICCGLK
jgi:hypothetical protein